jgi:hypothetical protein
MLLHQLLVDAIIFVTNDEFLRCHGEVDCYEYSPSPLSPQLPGAMSGQHSTLTIDSSEPDRALQRIQGRQHAQYRKVALKLTPCVYIY